MIGHLRNGRQTFLGLVRQRKFHKSQTMTDTHSHTHTCSKCLDLLCSYEPQRKNKGYGRQRFARSDVGRLVFRRKGKLPAV